MNLQKYKLAPLKSFLKILTFFSFYYSLFLQKLKKHFMAKEQNEKNYLEKQTCVSKA